MKQSFQTLIHQSNFISVGLISAIIGFFLLSYLFIYQGAYKIKQRSLKVQIVSAIFASGFLAVGIFFLLLGVGVYM